MEDCEYCTRHSYYREFTEEQLKSIEEGNADVCNSCHKWSFEGKTHEACRENRKTAKAERKSKVKKCDWFDGKGGNCKRNAEGDYCAKHSYVSEYTEEQKKASKECKKCHRFKYTGDRNVCESCR